MNKKEAKYTYQFFSANCATYYKIPDDTRGVGVQRPCDVYVVYRDYVWFVECKYWAVTGNNNIFNLKSKVKEHQVLWLSMWNRSDVTRCGILLLRKEERKPLSVVYVPVSEWQDRIDIRDLSKRRIRDIEMVARTNEAAWLV